MPRPSHHVLGLLGRRTFTNPWPTWEHRAALVDTSADALATLVQNRGPQHVFRWLREKRAKEVPETGWLTGNRAPTAADWRAAFPLVPTDWARLAAPPPSGAPQVTWVGHACCYVQLDGLTVLTDPVFEPRCSPFSFAGPLRVTPPALDVFDPRCPRPDAVFVSHNHYDHLCERTVRRLAAHFGPSLRWFVPLGLAAVLRASGVAAGSVTELDWWAESSDLGGATVACTPAQHWSARGILDRNRTLWCSWALLGPRHRFLFGGDSGYCPVFKETGAKYGPWDLAAIPIGAYEPAWFHRPAHMGPEEAVAAHADLKARASFGIHYGTWPLTDEPMDEPPARLAAAVAAAGPEAQGFVALRHGETWVAGAGR